VLGARRVHRGHHALGVSHGRTNGPDGLRNDEVRGHRASPEQGLSFAQNRLDETCTSHVNHEKGGLPNGVRRREQDVMDALNESRGRMNELGGRRGFRVERGRLPETCHGVLVELGSSRGACRHLLLGGHRVSRVNHELVEHRGRRNDEVRGLPIVMTERRPLKREACVVRGRQLLMPHESLNDLSDHLHKFLRFQNAR
jgi:hypothetical protein